MSQITLGMHILRADGRVGVVTGWKVVAGTKVMYNLEVAQDHTFTVGAGMWVVHNSDMCGGDQTLEEGHLAIIARTEQIRVGLLNKTLTILLIIMQTQECGRLIIILILARFK